MAAERTFKSIGLDAHKMTCLVFLAFLSLVLSQDPVSDTEEPPPGVPRTLVNSASKRQEFRDQAKETERQMAEGAAHAKKWEDERQQVYQDRLSKMTKAEQEERKDLDAMQKERVKSYKQGPKPMTKKEISECTGYAPDLPVLLSIKGRVYDVTSSSSFRAGGSYAFFAGRDSSNAFAAGNFGQEQLEKEDDLEGMTPQDLQKLEQWVSYFEGKAEYYYVGPLVDYKYHTGHPSVQKSEF